LLTEDSTDADLLMPATVLGQDAAPLHLANPLSVSAAAAASSGTGRRTGGAPAGDCAPDIADHTKVQGAS